MLATFLVNTTDDAPDSNPGDGLAQDANGRTTLRAAVMEAQALADADIITLPAGVYILTIVEDAGSIGAASGDFDISTELTINGAGSDKTVIDGNQASRLFDLGEATLILNGLALQNGKPDVTDGPDGGGIRAAASSLEMNNCVIRDCVAEDTYGGGVGGGISADNTSLKLVGTSVHDNLAASAGGGIYLNQSTAQILDCQILVNQTQGGGSGGGIYNLSNGNNSSKLTIRDTDIDGNEAANGGGLYNAGRDRTEGEVGPSAVAGAAVVIERASFVRNTASLRGGGIYNAVGTIDLENVTIGQNRADDSGGGLYQARFTEIYTHSTLHYVTIANNTTGGSGGGIFAPGAGNVTMGSSLLAKNTPENFAGEDGAIISEGHNLDDGTSAKLNGTGDIDDVNALLGPLELNGSTTFTYALLLGSPAIDAGALNGFPETDQRTVPRSDGKPDIGAFESSQQQPQAYDLLVNVAGLPNPATAGDDVTFTITVTNSGPVTSPAASVQFTLPPGTTFRSSSGNVAPVGGVVTFAVSSLGDDQSQVFQVVVGTQVAGAITGAAQGALGEGETNPSNNSAVASVTVVARSEPPLQVAPTVVGLARLGFHAQPTRLLLTFNGALDPALAVDLTQYQLIGSGRDRRLGTRDDVVTGFKRATYDASTRTVTLFAPHTLPLGNRYRIRVNGTESGVRGVNGLTLDGDGNGRAGGDYLRRFGREILVNAPGSTPGVTRVKSARLRHSPSKA